MTSPQATSARAGEQSGFVLVGVVIMALALTILGLSLFSLSNYESQFLERSLAADQAENKALGEIERAKLRLSTTPYLLQDVQAVSVLDPNVTADAWQIQGGDTVRTGPVSWDENEPVTINVTTTVGGVTRTTSGQFDFFEAPNYYKRLVTTAGQLVVDPEGVRREGTVRLTDIGYGSTTRWLVWQDSPDTSWKYHLDNWTGRIKLGGAPVPAVRGFIEGKSADAFLPQGDFSVSPTGIFTLSAPSGGVRYFRHVDPDSDGFSYYSPRELTFRVTGHVVVMFRYGLHLDHMLNVVAAGPDASLTLIAARNQNSPPPAPAPPGVAMWLEGGIHSPNVPVIIASDGDVFLEQNDADSEDSDTRVSSLSVFAQNVVLRGPLEPNQHHLGTHRMWFSYDRASNALVDELTQLEALPNTSPNGNRRLALVPGTWQMSAR